MPLIEKGILIEGSDGETLVRKYYERQKEVNRYSKAGNLIEERRERVEKYLKRKGTKVTRSREEKGYLWQMGYNHCVGHYSPAHKFSRFRGSSFNRDKTLIYDKKLDDGEENSLEMALKAARPYYKRGLELPGRLRDYLTLQNEETEGRFRVWLSGAPNWETDGISFPIYKLSPRS